MSWENICYVIFIIWLLVSSVLCFVRDRIRRRKEARNVKITVVYYGGYEVSFNYFNCEIGGLSKVIGTPIGDDWKKIVVENKTAPDAEAMNREARWEEWK